MSSIRLIYACCGKTQSESIKAFFPLCQTFAREFSTVNFPLSQMSISRSIVSVKTKRHWFFIFWYSCLYFSLLHLLLIERLPISVVWFSCSYYVFICSCFDIMSKKGPYCYFICTYFVSTDDLGFISIFKYVSAPCVHL